MKSKFFKFLISCFFIADFLLMHAQKNIAQPSVQETKTAGNAGIENILRRGMFIKVFTSSNKIFVGEPVMALYKFYTSFNGQAVVLKQPDFSGCSVNELNFDETPQTEMVNGKAYTTFIVRKVQLTPVEAGNLSLGIATVTNHIEIPNTEDAFVYNKYDIPVSNAPSSVAVTDLPGKNKPAGFYGITGSFTIIASVTDKKNPVNENDHLIITIKGSGNLGAINKPEIIWPANIEHFDGSDSQHIDQNDFPVSGDRTFDIPFIGKKEGVTTIPPVSFSYFNTVLKNYQTINTDGVTVTFTKALKKNVFNNVVNYDITNRKYLWIVGVIAFAAALIGFVNYKRNKIQLQKKLAMEQSITPVPVFEPKVAFKFKTDFSRYWNDLESLTDVKLFFVKAKELLMMAIAEFTNTTHHSELFLLAEMKAKLNDETLCKKIFTLNELCNEKIYAPFETETDLQLHFDEVKEVIEALQKKS